jgi:hypothetical protein
MTTLKLEIETGKSQPVWYWFKNDWIELSKNESKLIEEEYQKNLKEQRVGQIVYHCFGNGFSAIVDFDLMETICGSGRCCLKHGRPEGLSEDHMTYKLKRVL